MESYFIRSMKVQAFFDCCFDQRQRINHEKNIIFSYRPTDMKNTLLLILLSGSLMAQPFTPQETAAWKKQAQQINIIRDTWGIPHVYGKSDADAVFGLLYAQCEDDFARVEMNYIVAEGRLAEVEGEDKLYHDLRMRLFQDTLKAIRLYQTTPPKMKNLMQAFADGVNYFLFTHPDVKPKLLTRFQPWMPLLFSEGSIGGDIESVSVTKLKKFYGDGRETGKEMLDTDGGDGFEPEPRGSNGFAIAPLRSKTGNALLLINPHTSFYFRPEVHMVSEEGLNAYGAVTWGQYFVYQGFNPHCGWMHTSSQADAIDEYEETITKKNDSIFSKYGSAWLPVKSQKVKLAYRKADGMAYKEFTAFYIHNRPVIYSEGEKWISIRLFDDPQKALQQSFGRTKSTSLSDFQKVMDLRTNTSNNTVYADAQGNIAYWHGDFIPKRNPSFNWELPVDGSNPETEWKQPHEVSEIVHIINPANGWLQNCNSTPFTAAGENSPDQSKFPSYMAPDDQNPRGINAERVLKRQTSFTLDQLITAAYDPKLSAFEILIPTLLKAYEENGKTDEAVKNKLAEPINLLRTWDKSYSTASVPMTLAVYWGQELGQRIFSKVPAGSGQLAIVNVMAQATSSEKLESLAAVVNELEHDYGTWKVAWGEVNRFQRLTGKINETYDDAKPSLPVASTSSFWGCLAAFGSHKYPGTKKMYGNVGNSFVAVVEFGKTIKAKSLLAGGESNNPSSPHFTDQAERYTKGDFKDVWFYKDDVVKHAERTYHPGQ